MEEGDDLSFDLLFSGEGDSPSPSAGSPVHEDVSGEGEGKDDDEAADDLSSSAPTSTRRRTRTRKRAATLSKNDKEGAEREKSCVFVYSCNGKKLNWARLLSFLEEAVGEVRETYYRDNYHFGYLQFLKVDASLKAVEVLSQKELDDVVLCAERCVRCGPGHDNTDPSTPLVPNVILVIKNLPYNMKQATLLHILACFPDHKADDVSFHHDSAGLFRGMAFVKYASLSDAIFVFEHLNGIDVGGRPIKIEYKRKPDPLDEEHQKIQQQLLHFKDNDSMTDLAFPFSLSNSQRKQIHSISEKLGLRYQSFGENENRYIIVSKKKEEESRSPSTQIPKRKQSASSSSVAVSWNDRTGGGGPSSKYGSSWNDKSANLLGKTPPERDVHRTRSKDKWSASSSPSSSFSSSSSSSSSFAFYVPKREPKGPDGTNGFSSEYRASRLR